MSYYAKQQEYRLIKHIKKLGGKVLEYYGSRRLNKGDVLAEIGGLGIRFDHKSTVDMAVFKFDLTWLPKLLGHCNDNVDEDGVTFPAISFSYKKCHDIFVCSYKRLGDPNDSSVTINDTFINKLNNIWLGDLRYMLRVNGHYVVKFDNKYDTGIGWFYTLETFIKGVEGL